jgi:flagellar biosynthesis protein
MTAPDSQKTSIALNYDGSGAPVISASGAGLIAEEILERAKQAGVPVIEDARLASLLSTIPLGEEIPRELYEAVAKVLVFVLQLESSFERSA